MDLFLSSRDSRLGLGQLLECPSASEMTLQVMDTLTLLMLETKYSGFGVNAMSPDALTSHVARASAAMALVV